jgi:hypothetical protein
MGCALVSSELVAFLVRLAAFLEVELILHLLLGVFLCAREGARVTSVARHCSIVPSRREVPSQDGREHRKRPA